MSERQSEARLPLAEAPAEGAVRMLDIGPRRVGLYRVGGALHALADRCPHRGAPLCSGMVATPVRASSPGGLRGTGGEVALGQRNSTVRCPWHKWEFDIASGRCLVDERLRVRRYAVRVEDDEIVVTLQPARAAAIPASR